MSIALTLVTLDCESQFRDLFISILAFVLNTLVFTICLVGRSLALEAVGVRTRVGFGCLFMTLKDGTRFGCI